MGAALAGEADADVPCAGCTACCASSRFVHIEPDEVDALARIPHELLFPAPHRPEGHLVLGYDERGRCPMLGDDGCSIYAHRPRTCRTFDCRVFAAAGIDPDDEGSAVAQRARRWRFDTPSDGDRQELASVRVAATAFIAERRPPTEVALRAVEVALSRRLGSAPSSEPPPDAPSQR
jgi:hypothetical protein